MEIASLYALPDCVAWPSDLSWMLRHLKPYSLDPLTQGVFSPGGLRQRREWWLIGGARGVVSLDAEDWAALSDFVHDVIGNALITAQLPEPYGNSLMTFTRGSGERPTLVVEREFITQDGHVRDVAVDVTIHGFSGLRTLPRPDWRFARGLEYVVSSAASSSFSDRASEVQRPKQAHSFAGFR